MVQEERGEIQMRMARLANLTAIVLLNAGCTTTGKELEAQELRLMKAVENGDITAVRDSLKTNGGLPACRVNILGVKVKMATSLRNAGADCRREKEEIVKKVFVSLQPKVLAVLLDEGVIEIDEAAGHFDEHVLGKQMNGFDADRLAEQGTEKLQATFEVLSGASKSECAKALAPACENAQKHVKSIKNKLEWVAKQAAKAKAEEQKEIDLVAEEKSPEGIHRQACEAVGLQDDAQAMIDEQKEIGRISGIVNMEQLHTWGTVIVLGKADIKKFHEEYKSKTGKALDLSDCAALAH